MPSVIADRRGSYPCYVGDLELSDLKPIPLAAGNGAALLIRLHGVPLGTLTLDPSRAHAGIEAVADTAITAYREVIITHLRADGVTNEDLFAALRTDVTCLHRPPPSLPIPTVTVIVCTLGTHPILPVALRALLDQDMPRELFEILVVDNDPNAGHTRAVLDAMAPNDADRILYVAQPTKGLPNARNAGAAAAAGDVVAFTDDDVVADPAWVRTLAAVMAESPIISVVTGLVLPAALDTQAQQLFEVACEFEKGYERVVWSMTALDDRLAELGRRGDRGPFFPFAAGKYGTGANMAFRAGVLPMMGGFDPAMTNSEDIDMFFRVIFGGGVIVYEPRALVRHHHHDAAAAIPLQMYNYGIGFSAFLTKQLLHTKGAVVPLVTLAPRGAWAIIRDRRVEWSNPDTIATAGALPVTLPRNLRIIEFRGFLRGPFRYLSARRRARHYVQ